MLHVENMADVQMSVWFKCPSYVLSHHRVLDIAEEVGNTIALHFTEEEDETLRLSLWTQVLW